MQRHMLVVILLLGAMVPVTTAQDDIVTDFVLMGTDPAGDTDGLIAQQAGQPQNAWGPLDMLTFEMMEDTTTGFTLRLGIESLEIDVPATGDPPSTGESMVDQFGEIADDMIRGVSYGFQFALADREYQLRTFYMDDPMSLESYIQVRSADGWYETLAEVPVEIDEDLPGFEWLISYDVLADSNGKAPRKGDSFAEMAWYSNSLGPTLVHLYTFGTTGTGYDDFPDRGVLDSTWDVQAGSISVGHIDAYAPLPVRVSNGEATTFLYEVEVTNTADYVDTVLPEWSGGAENWIVTFPEGKVRLDPEETKTIPFLVTVPFAHKHGTYWPFEVSFQSQADPEAIGRVELGVRYTAIPQPAGHHPTLYLHDAQSYPYFNTIQGEDYPEDPTETEEIGGGSSRSSCSGGGYSATAYRLSPGLQMGVDVDMEAIGQADLKVYSELGSSGTVFSGYFVIDDDRPDLCRTSSAPEGAIAYVEPTEPISLGQGEESVVTTTITPLEGGDYVPYEQGNQLWLLWLRSSDNSQSGDPIGAGSIGSTALLDDSSFTLPLSEYHDDVDDFFGALSGIDLFATTSQERLVNPGETVLFHVTAQNIGVVDTELDLELVGSNTDWAYILGAPDEVELEPGESVDLTVVVLAPPSAVDEEMADVTLVLSNQEDESIRSLIRLLAQVDTDVDHEDESAVLAALDGELQEAPAPSGLAILGAMGAAVAAVRRRE